MARVKGGFTTRRRRKKVLKLAKGYFGAKHRLYKTAHEQVMHSLAYSYRDRRQVKRDMRKLWIARINAAARLNDISLSTFFTFDKSLRQEQSSILLTILKTSSTLLLKSIFISTLFIFIPPKQYNINLL